MLAVVRELVDRYRHHPSFEGLAIGTPTHSFAFLPGPAWPSDPRTLQQFSQEAGVPLPPGSPPGRWQSPLRDKWLDWRAYRLREFHGRLAAEVQRAGPQSKLYLSLAPMLDSPDIQQMLRPALPPRAKPLDGLLGIGINPRLYADHPGTGQTTILLNPTTLAAEFRGDRRAVFQQTHAAQEFREGLAASGEVGFLQALNPASLRLPSFDQKSPFGADHTHTVLSPHLTPAGRAIRRRVVQALAELDTAHVVRGGPLLPLGQEEELRDLMIAYRRLPAQPFQPVPGKYQPLTIRQLSWGQHTYVYLVNDSPWPCRCAARIIAPGAVAVEELSGRRPVAPPNGENWSVELDRYDFLAVRFNASGVQLADVQVTLPADVTAGLQTRIQHLGAKAASLAEKRPIDVLANPGFEQPVAAGAVPGWRLIGNPPAKVTGDQQEKHVGQASLQFHGRDGGASLISDPFPAPPTGRIAFTVWLKAGPDFQGPLRLAVGGTHRDAEFYRHGVAAATDAWQLFEFSANDLPLSDVKDLTLRFDLMGPGTVWIDEITVSDLRFSENERTELSRLLTHANFALQSGQVTDCLRLLDGYWPDFLERHVPLPPEPLVEDRPPLRQAERSHREDEPPADAPPWWKPRLPFWR